MASRRILLLSLTLSFIATVTAAQQPYHQPQAEQYIKILEDPHRIERLNPAEIIRKLDLKPGYVVADIGSGSGLFTRPLAQAVQPGGHVYAVDIDADLLKHVQRTAKAASISNITTVLAPEEAPGLAPASLDVALICDTLHHIGSRQEYLANLRSCMKPGGRVAIIDFKEDWPAGHESMRFELADLDRWTAAAGYTKAAEFDTVPGNFFRIYRVSPGKVAGSQGSPGIRQDQEWGAYGHDAGGARFSPLQQINTGNVARLERAWTYHTGESDNPRKVAFESTPLVVAGVLYFSTPGGRIVALDAESGQEIWRFDTQAGRVGDRTFTQHRGVSYWRQERGGERRILFGTGDGRLMSLDAATGRPDPRFGDHGAVDLRKGAADRWPESEYAVTSPPAIYRDLVITGALVPEGPALGPSGVVRAFDVRTGRLEWSFETIPPPGQPGHETWDGDSWKNRTGANVWSIMSVDTERGILFLPVGSPAYDFYGGDRKGQNLYANCLVALDAATGRMRWYYQMVHHDVWDYDLPAQPVLVEIVRDGKTIPAVVQVTKMGFAFVLDRLTGKPLFPVEERPAPPSDVPGESAWPTQPVPVKPPALARTSITGDQLNEVTDELGNRCREIFTRLKGGSIFTPYGQELTLVMPGTLGGATWSGASFDPGSRYLFVNVNETGAIGAMQPDPSRRFRRSSPWGEYARFWDPETHIPCAAPPWGTLNAIDLNTGEIAWRVPLGVVDSLVAKGIPPTGTSNIGGSIATAGGLIFIAGTNDGRFRAFDSATGRELWAARLEASGHATPATFMAKGRQFVVVAAGGGGYFSNTVSDTLAAYALPRAYLAGASGASVGVRAAEYLSAR